MNWKEPKVYAVKHKDEDTRAVSRSGGIFTALSDEVLEKHGVVYGCVLNENFDAVHVRADNTEDRNRMRGSKYIQSRLGDTFRNVKADLEEGRIVLFSGTSCQVAGLKAYLQKDYENLICVDIVCHGVPSTKVWDAYLSWQKEKNSSKITTVNFRNKKDFGWRAHMETLYFENNKVVSSGVFRTLFYGHNVLRPSCYECPYKSTMHPGDITIADYWGIENAAPEFDDNKGVSLVLVNNEAGEKILDEVKDKLIWRETRIEDSMQPPLKAPFPQPETREQFWKDFEIRDFSYITKKYGGAGFKNGMKRFLGKVKRKLKRLVKG